MNAKLLLLVALLPLSVSSVALAREYRCDIEPEVVVETGRPDALTVVCRNAEKAIRFLAQYQLHPKKAIRVLVVEQGIIIEGYDAYGSYDIHSERVKVMSYRAILDLVGNPEMYDERLDAMHYAGVVAHEVAHAVVQQNLAANHISPVAQEYLAHATQLAVLPAARRDRIIQARGVGPWETGDAISDVYMAMDPGKFAVKSYLHLMGLEQPEDFLKLLLNANRFYVYVP